jgi:hypothetical protein
MILFLTCVPRPHEERIVQTQNALGFTQKHDAMVGSCEKEVRNHTLIDSHGQKARRPPPVVTFEHEFSAASGG